VHSSVLNDLYTVIQREDENDEEFITRALRFFAFAQDKKRIAQNKEKKVAPVLNVFRPNRVTQFSGQYRRLIF
jgi:hypothetical protein